MDTHKNESDTVVKTNWHRWLIVCVFAIAMAWVEAAVVFDLRTMVDRIQPYQADPLPLVGKLGPVELGRELATMIMLLTTGMLAGKTWPARFGYAALAFGLWDIFYYIFLKVMCGWPHSFLDWDILFLLPLPWWGPVIAPVLIALLMVGWGTLATQFEHPPATRVSNATTWSICFTGMLLALYVFMTDPIRVLDQGVEVIRNVLPAHFNWPLFMVALAFMAVPVARLVWNHRKARNLAATTALLESN